MLTTLGRRYVGGVLFNGNQVLLGKRSPRRERYPGVWDIFGGHIEQGESSYQALSREMQEELGIVVLDALHGGIVSGFGDPDPTPFTMSVYLISSWAYRPSINNLEHEELQWFWPDELEVLVGVIDPRLPSLIQTLIALHAPDELPRVASRP